MGQSPQTDPPNEPRSAYCQTPGFLGELCNFKDAVQTQSAAVPSHCSLTTTSHPRFSDSNYFPTVVFAHQPITLTESLFLESLTFWPEWSTSAWMNRIFKLTICQRDTLVLLLLNIFTKNQGFTKVKTLLGIKDKGKEKQRKCFIDLKSSSRLFRTSQMDYHQRLWPHCGWFNN